MESVALDELLSVGSSWAWAFGLLVGAAVAGLLGYALLWWFLRSVARRIGWTERFQEALIQRIPGPLRLLVPTLCVYAVVPTVAPSLPSEVVGGLQGLLYGVFVAASAWMLIALFFAGEEAVAEYYTVDVPDNLKARRIVTQVQILRRVATAVVVVLAMGMVLLRFEPFRELGAGILASAGIVGIILGIAAQRTLGDLIAGLQIALTQPIRVDDVVIVEDQFGWIEEITLTYVVVRVWDRRRIVLPITHFVENPFQNWTRTSADLIGSVFLYVDYRTPIQALRDELYRVVEGSDHWDGDVCALHVTDTTERCVEVRAIASAGTAPQLWELRCEIRERLVAFLQDRHPEALPHLRAQVQQVPGPDRTPDA